MIHLEFDRLGGMTDNQLVASEGLLSSGNIVKSKGYARGKALFRFCLSVANVRGIAEKQQRHSQRDPAGQ